MVRDLIEGIKSAEAEAAGIIEQAKKQKADIVAKAKEDARKLIESTRKQGAEQVKQALAKAQEDAGAETEGIASKEQAARRTIKEASSANISKAVDLVIERTLK